MVNPMRRFAVAAALLLAGGLAAAVMTSSNGWRMFGTGQASAGGAALSGGTYTGSSTLGAFSPTSMSGGGYSLTPVAPQTGRGAQSDLSQAHAYPNPFRASAGHTVVNFTRLTAQAKIRVFTVSGELVRTLEKNDASTDTFPWDTLNSNGHQVASGLYLYVIEGQGDSKHGKLAVIR